MAHCAVRLIKVVLTDFFCGFSIRCRNGMNHKKDRVPHTADGLCQYAHQYNNKVLICKVIEHHTHCFDLLQSKK